MALCRRVMEAHVHSVVKIGCRKKKRGKEKATHMDPNKGLCLVMSCGHVLEGHIEGSVHVSFGDTKIGASVVFADYAQEVSMVRIDKSTSPDSFDAIAGYPPVRWSANEAQEKNLIAILSRVADPDNHLCNGPSVHHGTVSVAPRLEPKKKNDKVPLHLGTADYTSVKGNSGSAIFNQALQVVGIHVSAHELMARFVCLQGVALVMKKHLEKAGAMSSDAGRSPSVAYLLEKIAQSQSAGVGTGPSSSSAGAGPGPSSSSAGAAGAGAP